MKIKFSSRYFSKRLNANIHKSAKIYSNNCIENNLNCRNAITVGAHTHVKGQLLTFGHGGEINIGEYCYIGESSKIWSAKNIFIGNRVLISHNANIFDNNTHPFDPIERHYHFRSIITSGHPKFIDLNEKPVYIEDDVWISCMTVILPGVRIGRGAIIAAGSVVTNDIEPFCLVAGNPGKMIKKLNSKEYDL